MAVRYRGDVRVPEVLASLATLAATPEEREREQGGGLTLVESVG